MQCGEFSAFRCVQTNRGIHWRGKQECLETTRVQRTTHISWWTHGETNPKYCFSFFLYVGFVFFSVMIIVRRDYRRSVLSVTVNVLYQSVLRTTMSFPRPFYEMIFFFQHHNPSSYPRDMTLNFIDVRKILNLKITDGLKEETSLVPFDFFILFSAVRTTRVLSG